MAERSMIMGRDAEWNKMKSRERERQRETEREDRAPRVARKEKRRRQHPLKVWNTAISLLKVNDAINTGKSSTIWHNGHQDETTRKQYSVET